MRKENLKTIKGITYKPTFENYWQALSRMIDSAPDLTNTEEKNRFIYLFLKCFITSDVTDKSFEFFEVISGCLSTLTTKEFMQIFPIEKNYDGEKYQMKDYFSTMEMIAGYDAEEAIGFDNIQNFLWDYQNRDIRDFMVKGIGSMDRIRRQNGEMGIVEEFLSNHEKKPKKRNPLKRLFRVIVGAGAN